MHFSLLGNYFKWHVIALCPEYLEETKKSIDTFIVMDIFKVRIIMVQFFMESSVRFIKTSAKAFYSLFSN
jgi:hypothetical protein